MYVRGEALNSLSEKGKVEEKYQGFHGADETLTQHKSKYISQSPCRSVQTPEPPICKSNNYVLAFRAKIELINLRKA